MSLHKCAAVRAHCCCRYIQPYIGSFFSLPVKRRSGERLSHEEVVDQLDEQTVFYDVGPGISGMFAETLRITIRVELAKYELAVAWLRDLLYGSEFTKERSVLFSCDLRTAVMTGFKGSRLQWPRCNSRCLDLNEMGARFYQLSRRSCCTMRTPRPGQPGCLSSLTSSEACQRKSKKLPKKLLRRSKVFVEAVSTVNITPTDFLYSPALPVTDPTGVRFSVTGNILGVPKPRDIWNKYFGNALPVS